MKKRIVVSVIEILLACLVIVAMLARHFYCLRFSSDRECGSRGRRMGGIRQYQIHFHSVYLHECPENACDPELLLHSSNGRGSSSERI